MALGKTRDRIYTLTEGRLPKPCPATGDSIGARTNPRLVPEAPSCHQSRRTHTLFPPLTRSLPFDLFTQGAYVHSWETEQDFRLSSHDLQILPISQLSAALRSAVLGETNMLCGDLVMSQCTGTGEGAAQLRTTP